jgi:hypothetical protein
MSALDKQVGGKHYKQFKIQPIQYITANNIPYIEGNIIKYISRWRDKGGIDDLDKVIHYVELLKETEVGKSKRTYGCKARVQAAIKGWSRQLGSNIRKKNKGTEANSGGYGPGYTGGVNF